jgi:hypothetical protein
MMNGMLNKVVAWFRAGYPKDAPQLSYTGCGGFGMAMLRYSRCAPEAAYLRAGQRPPQ